MSGLHQIYISGIIYEVLTIINYSAGGASSTGGASAGGSEL